jgi:leader peptidase (prepilin peptidase)/N-methyltransferase
VTTYIAVVCGVFGLVIGSFLNVVVWRVPRGESIVQPPSHCPRCNTQLNARDNVPVLSWLLLRGRCRHCGEPISARYPLVELTTGVLFAGFAVHFGWHAVLPAYLYLAAVGVALALIDFDHHRLPDALTLPSYPVALVLLAVAAVAEDGHTPFLRALWGMLALFAFYALLWLVYPAGMGLGDVKLSGVLGLYLGWIGWGALVVGAFSAFVLGGLVGIGVILVAGGGRKTKVPFGPFMLLGTLVGILWGQSLADAYTSLTTV